MLVACLNRLEEVGDLADLVELRLDAFEDLSQPQKPSWPAIFTFRKKAQGGLRDLSEQDRFAFLEKWLAVGPAYCDLEADTDPAAIERIARRFPDVKLIGSYHNFDETPDDLEGLLAGMKNPHFSLYKIAVTARSTLDLLRLMVFRQRAAVPLTVIALGEHGKPSRVLGPIVGNALNYAGLEEDLKLHRYSLQTLHEIFHYRKLNRDTRIYALLGDPVEHSIGHLFHNPRFPHNAVYVKMRLTPAELPEFFRLMHQLPFGGFSVTMPLKEAILPYLDEIDPTAKAIGAVNTVTLRNSKTIGTNTDAPGALNAIEKHLSPNRIAILGAGGTARAIAYEAKQRGIEVAVFNRTAERSNAWGCPGHSLEELSDYPYDLLINTIPLQAGVFPPLRPGATVMDVVYAPRETPILAAAKKLGCPCIYGEEMFTEQALLQQQAWKKQD